MESKFSKCLVVFVCYNGTKGKFIRFTFWNLFVSLSGSNQPFQHFLLLIFYFSSNSLNWYTCSEDFCGNLVRVIWSIFPALKNLIWKSHLRIPLKLDRDCSILPWFCQERNHKSHFNFKEPNYVDYICKITARSSYFYGVQLWALGDWDAHAWQE